MYVLGVLNFNTKRASAILESMHDVVIVLLFLVVKKTEKTSVVTGNTLFMPSQPCVTWRQTTVWTR